MFNYKPLIGSDMWPTESRHSQWPSVTFRFIYLLHVF